MLNKKKYLFAFMVLVILLTSSIVFASGSWKGVSNVNNGGKFLIWNPTPSEGETVTWEGGKISHFKLMGEEPGFPIDYAHGYGKATWYLNGDFEQSDEGYHYGGKRNGKIIQRFADGRVIESYWDHGVRVD